MTVIQPDTKAEWKRVLIDEYDVDEEQAEKLVAFIGSGLGTEIQIPETEAQLADAVDAIREDMERIEFTEFGAIEDGIEVRIELMTTLRRDLGLESFEGPLPGSADAQQAARAQLRNEAPEPSGEEEINAEVQELAAILADAVEDETHPLNLETLPTLFEAVQDEVSERAEDNEGP